MRWDGMGFLFPNLHKNMVSMQKPEFGMKKKTTRKIKDR